MIRSERSLLVAALLAAMANAQTTTSIINPLDPGVSTLYVSICPSALTTTVTSPTTLTFCPGDFCGGGGPTITPPPSLGDAEYTSTILHVTFTGADGKVTELAEYVTVFDAPCTTGTGMCQATYTVTHECPCQTVNPTDHFTTTVHTCAACGVDGSPSRITQTIPCSTASYSAEVNPTGAYASAGAQASAGAAASAGVGSGSGASGSGGAAAGADAGADSQGAASAGSSTPGWANAAAGAGADADAAAVAGTNGAGAGVDAGMGSQGASPGTGAGSGSAGNNAVGAGMDNNAVGAGMGNGTSPPIAGYTGAADKTMFAVSTLFIAVVGSLIWIL